MLPTLPLLLPLLAAFARQDTPPAAPATDPAPAPAARPLLLKGGIVHSMVPGEAPRIADVLVVDGHIRALGADATSESDPEVLDVSGKHLVPGLIDGHVNFDPEHDALYLAAGVTLVRDLGGDHYGLYLERELARRDRVPGPALLTAGAALDGDPPASGSAVVLRNADSAESYLPILFEENVDFLSVLPGLPEDAWKKTIAMAHARELGVFGPRPARLSLEEALAAGQDGFQALDSLLPVGVLWDKATVEGMQPTVEALAQSKKPLVPLLHASALRLVDQQNDPARRAASALLGPAYESWWRAELDMRRPFLDGSHRALGEVVLAKQTQLLGRLFQTGAVLLPGSGAPQPWCVPGTALHQELAQWLRAGIPPQAVLDLATRGAAEALGLAGQRGTLVPGAWADLLVLERDPTHDLANLLEPLWVVVRGKAVSHDAIQERLQLLASHQASWRAELLRPVEVPPPPQAEEGIVLLEGTVESQSYGTRVSTERYRVVRLGPDTLLFTSRIAFPSNEESPEKEMTLEQFQKKGRLEQVHVTLREGESVLKHDGLWTAGTWRMQTRMDGQLVNAQAPFRDQPVCIDAGSVAAFLILGQRPAEERVPVVQLHGGLDAEAVNWRVEVDPDGTHKIRTNVGYKAFRLDEAGGVELALHRIGPGLVETRSLGSSAFGGAGLPPLVPYRSAPESPADSPSSEPAAKAPGGG